jgi:cell fate regulator YaaT (PSP1 superfamily)
MPKVAEVRLAYNPKVLWFDPGDLEFERDDALIVRTERGLEFGHAENPPREVTQEQIDSLRSELKPVERVATEEDQATFEELERKGDEALDVFREVVEKRQMNMNPVGVEYLFSGDKAVFYFEAEERVDFRDLVRELASKFHVRIDMRQVGVRDKARLVGGYGSCGQELCCRRLGGKFNPVSIRMAKDQDLSLNPQKISGICGRLMCCLRYEEEGYKEFKTRCPKVNAKISTPAGTAKVVEVSMPLEEVTVLTEENKRVRVPLEKMTTEREGSARPDTIPDDVFEEAINGGNHRGTSADVLVTSMFTGSDKLAGTPKAHHLHEDADGGQNGRKGDRRRRRRRGKGSGEHTSDQRRSGQESRRRGQDASHRNGQGASGEHRQKRRSRTVVVNAEAAQEAAKQAQEASTAGGQRAQGQSSRRQRSKRRPGQRSSGLAAEARSAEASEGSNRGGKAEGNGRGQSGSGSGRSGSGKGRSNRRRGQNPGREGSSNGGNEARKNAKPRGEGGGQGGSNGRGRGKQGGQAGRGGAQNGQSAHHDGQEGQRAGSDGQRHSEHRTSRRRSHKTQGGEGNAGQGTTSKETTD